MTEPDTPDVPEPDDTDEHAHPTGEPDPDAPDCDQVDSATVVDDQDGGQEL